VIEKGAKGVYSNLSGGGCLRVSPLGARAGLTQGESDTSLANSSEWGRRAARFVVRSPREKKGGGVKSGVTGINGDGTENKDRTRLDTYSGRGQNRGFLMGIGGRFRGRAGEGRGARGKFGFSNNARKQKGTLPRNWKTKRMNTSESCLKVEEEELIHRGSSRLNERLKADDCTSRKDMG